jgi:hypothetical protein
MLFHSRPTRIVPAPVLAQQGSDIIPLIGARYPSAAMAQLDSEK